MKGKYVAPWFYAHPLIKYLAEDNWYSKPAYLTSANFSKVIIDLLKGIDNSPSQSLQLIHESIENGTIHKIPMQSPDLANPAVKRLNKMGLLNDGGNTVELNESTAMFLKSLWHDSGGDVTVFQAKLEQWFNDTMERTTGWFKKYTRIVLFLIGLGLAYTLNIDTFAIKRILVNDPDVREEMVKLAIANHQQLDPEKLLGKDTSLLDSTYKMLSAESKKVNDILGLGRPWKDTLSMWKDSLKKGFLQRMDSISPVAAGAGKQVEEIGISQQRMETEYQLAVQEFRTRKAALEKKEINDSIWQADSSRLAAVQSDLVKTMRQDKDRRASLLATVNKWGQMKKLQERAQYIRQMTAGKWNLYSPHQNGGWETLFGWIITALAIMLGAPFWFDLLSKLIKLRGTGTKISTWDGPTPPPTPAPAGSSPMQSVQPKHTDEEAVG